MWSGKLSIWYLASFTISLIVVIPILTVFSSFFEDTSQYFEILKKTFFIEYIFNSLILLIGVLFLTFIINLYQEIQLMIIYLKKKCSHKKRG